MTAADNIKQTMARIGENDRVLGAFLRTDESASEQALEIDARITEGKNLPLAGVSVALKDNICWGKTTCGSRMLEDYVSPFEATAAQRLVDAGAIIIGKTNMDEFAMGSSCEHSAFAPTRNPWDLERVPGGSSGGSAAAVAAGMVRIALGSDTGGSIRQPAALCGVVGLKPTYGRVSRWGLVAFASSLDQIGPIARNVKDCALALQIMSGFDPHDSTSSKREVPDMLVDLDTPIENLVIGVPRGFIDDGVHPAVKRAFDDAVAVYESLGAEVRDIDLPHAGHGVETYYVVASAEASSNLARFDGVRYGRRAELNAGDGGGGLEELYCKSRSEGFGPEVQRRIMLGTHVLLSGYHDAYYTTALKVRRLIKNDYDAVFASGCDAVMMPTTPGPAFKIGEKIDDPLALYLEDVFTVGANLAGLPGISLPAGFVEQDLSPQRRQGEGHSRQEAAMAPGEGAGLPVGVQLIAPAWGEDRLLRIARMFERATEWSDRRPSID